VKSRGSGGNACTTTAYGKPAIELLARQISASKNGDPLSAVTVIVRSNFVAVSTRRALAAQPGGIANVTFTTLKRLAEQRGASELAQIGRRPVSAPVTTAAVRMALTTEPGIFAPVADHPATEEALVAAHRELRGVPDGTLNTVAACSDRARDVVRIHRAARDILSPDWYDEEDLLTAAADHVLRSGSDTTEPVIGHLLSSYTHGEEALLRALASRGAVHVNVGLTGDRDADLASIAAHERIGFKVSAADVETACASSIISASDPDDEVRAAVRQITAWMHEGVRLGKIGLLYPTADPYARLLEEHLSAAGIAVGVPVRGIGDMMLGRAVRQILALPERTFHRRDVLGFLTSAIVLTDGGIANSRSWEKVSRAAGVVGGDDWDTRLRAWVENQRRQADLDAAADLDDRANRRRREADHAQTLADFVARLRTDLDVGAETRSWRNTVEWLRNLVQTYLGGEQRRRHWPNDEQHAAGRVEEILDRLSHLDAVPGPPPSLDVFRRTLNSELNVSLRRLGGTGDGVLIGHVSTAAGMMFDRVMILGLSEGRFPSRRLEDSLLPDVERAAAGGALPLRGHRVYDDRRDMLAAIAGADHAVLCQPRGDLRRSTQEPASRWLLADATRLARTTVTADDLVKYSGSQWLQHIPSFAGGHTYAQSFPSDQALRLAAITRRQPTHPVLNDDPRTTAALEVVHARRSSAFTRFDGNLANAANDIDMLAETSTTRLEAWATCPRSYLFTHLLGVQPVEEPERRFEIDALTRGSVVHAILEEFVKGAIEQEHSFQHWTAADHEQLQRIAADHFDRIERAGQTGKAILWRAERVRLAGELDRFLERDSGRLAAGLRPIAAEHEFRGIDVMLPSGRALQLRGSIDRIDRAVDGSLEVVDYKTGSASNYRALTEDQPHDGGKKLQLFVYGRAARRDFPGAPSVRAGYWFTKDDRVLGYPLTDEVEAKMLNALDMIVTGIGAGVFPARPVDAEPWGFVDCWYCTPDGLSGEHARRLWNRKRDDPALAIYLALSGAGGDEGGA